VLEGGVELRTAFRLALEAAGDDDRVALVVVVLGLGRELLEVLADRGEDLLADALRAGEGPGRGVAAARLDPLDLGGEPLEDTVGIAAVERLVGAADGLHILFRHMPLLCRTLGQSTLCRADRSEQGRVSPRGLRVS